MPVIVQDITPNNGACYMFPNSFSMTVGILPFCSDNFVRFYFDVSWWLRSHIFEYSLYSRACLLACNLVCYSLLIALQWLCLEVAIFISIDIVVSNLMLAGVGCLHYHFSIQFVLTTLHAICCLV